MRCRKTTPGVCVAKILCLLLLVGSLFGIVSLKSDVVSLRYTLGVMEKTKTQLMRDNKLLLAERAHLTSIERFEKVSMKESGFIIPDRRHVVAVKLHKGKDTYKASFPAGARDGIGETAALSRE